MKLLPSSVVSFIYRNVSRILPSDITHVLLYSRRVGDDVTTGLTGENLSADSPLKCRELTPQELLSLKSDRHYEIKSTLLDDIDTQGYRCFGAVRDGRILGYLLCGTGTIPAKHNSGGSRFQGIGLTLPDSAGYIFKCLVLSEYRGQGVLPQLLQYVMHADIHPVDIRHWVTTTDISNHSALKAFERAGFHRVAIAAECVLAGKHLFRTPAVSVGKAEVIQLTKPSANPP